MGSWLLGLKRGLCLDLVFGQGLPCCDARNSRVFFVYFCFIGLNCNLEYCKSQVV
jgi:hypothetical protein